jgi:hypothetical protein
VAIFGANDAEGNAAVLIGRRPVAYVGVLLKFNPDVGTNNIR